MKADDLVAAVLPILEHRRDDARVEQLRLHRLEILGRRAIDEHARGSDARLQLGVQRMRDPLAPKRVQILAARVRKTRAHLEPVRLQQVERPQQPVEPREHANMPLRVVEIIGRQRACVEALVDVAVECEHRLLRVRRRRRARPVGVALEIQARERVGDAHQRGDLLRRQPAQLVDQRGRVIGELGLRVVGNVRRSFVVERFRRGENDYHRGSPARRAAQSDENHRL